VPATELVNGAIETLREDIRAVEERDPAAGGKLEIVPSYPDCTRYGCTG
jgi:hypothetical protein